MGFASSDVVAFTQARANVSELADQAKAGADHRFERERIHLLLINDAKRGVADIAAGRTFEADGALSKLQQRRTAAAKTDCPIKPAETRGRQVSWGWGQEGRTNQAASWTQPQEKGVDH